MKRSMASWLAAVTVMQRPKKGIRTAPSNFARNHTESIELQLLFFHHLLVHLELGADLLRELLGRVADDQRARVLDALLDRRVFERLLHRAVDLVDDVLRQALG